MVREHITMYMYLPDQRFWIQCVAHLLTYFKNTKHKIYPLGKILSLQYSIINCRYCAVQMPRPNSSYVLKLSTIQLIPPYFPLLLVPGNCHSTLCFYEFDYFSFLIQLLSCSVCLYVSGLFVIIMYSRFIHPWHK